MKKALVGLIAGLFLVPMVGMADVPECPPVDADAVYICIDGEAVEIEGRITTGVSMHLFDGAEGPMYRTFLRVGYEVPVFTNLFIRTGLNIKNPMSPLNSWYIIDALGKYHLTQSLGILVGLDFGFEMDKGRVADADWTMPVGAHYSFGGLDPGLGVWVTGHIGEFFDPDMPLFEAFFSAGIEFRW